MSRSNRRLTAALIAVSMAMAATVMAVPATAATVHFQKESLQAYEGQLHHGEVHAVTVHPGTTSGHLHISLNNGSHVSVTYAASEQAKLVAAAQAANARVKVAKVKAKKAVAPVKHKLRYIAGGILIVVIIVVLVVLMIGRRRVVAQDGRPRPGESPSS